MSLAETTDRRLRVTRHARRAVAEVRRARGPLAIRLSWPSGVAYLPSRHHSAGPYDVIIGHVAGCPVYADVRQLTLFRDRRAVLDALSRAPLFTSPRRPVLRLSSAPADSGPLDRARQG
jgi:uncharacterized protein (DUF779 family)